MQGAALLESALRPFLRQGDLFARLDQDSALAALRAADHDQVAVVARRIHALWRQQGELPPLRLAGIVAPKSGRSPALLFHRLLQARDIAVAGAAADLVFYSEQLTGRDSSLRRVVLGDDLVAQLNSRAITLSRRPVRQCDGGAALFYDLVGKAGALGAGLSALRPLYAPLDMAGLLDHRIAELSLAQCASSPHPVCLFLSALTAEQGWLDLIEAGAPRRGFDGRLIVDFPADDFALAPSDFRHVASRLRDLGCRLSVSGVAEVGDYPPLPFDFCRLGGLGLGDLARSADERFRHRRLVEAIKDSGARPVVPVEADAEARGFLVASGVDLVEGATVEGPQEAAFDASVAA